MIDPNRTGPSGQSQDHLLKGMHSPFGINLASSATDEPLAAARCSSPPVKELIEKFESKIVGQTSGPVPPPASDVPVNSVS